MTARTLKHLTVSAMVLSCVALAHGQAIGLQVADTAEARTAGDLDVTAGTVFGNDRAFYGVRGTYNLLNELRAFADIGSVDLDGLHFASQVGALYSLPGEFISDLGVRAALYYADTAYDGIFGGNVMLTSSGETLLDGLFLQGGIGLDVSKREDDATRSVSSPRTEVNPLVTVGIIYSFTPNIGVYGEISYLDTDVFAGVGVRIGRLQAPAVPEPR